MINLLKRLESTELITKIEKKGFFGPKKRLFLPAK